MDKKDKIDIKSIQMTRYRRKIWWRISSFLMAVVVFMTTYSLILPAITLEKQTYCGMKEHIHSEYCSNIQSCSSKNQVCLPGGGYDDFVIHKHDATCYDMQGKLVCTLEERELHTHDERCYAEDGSLICEKAELEQHTHTEMCYDQNGMLVCGLPQTIEHQHSDSCFENIVKAEETDTGNCNLEEHEHTEKCYSAPKTLMFSYTEGNVSGTITLPWQSGLPEDLSCTLKVMDGSENVYNDLYQSASRLIQEEEKTLSYIRMYQLNWESSGVTYELPEGLIPTIQLEIKDQKIENIKGLIFEEYQSVTRSAIQLTNSAIQFRSRTLDTYLETMEIPTTMEDMGTQYSAVPVTIENGIAEMKLGDTNIFALIGTKTTAVSNHYYKRVDSLDEIKAHYNDGYTEKYVIVYANGISLAFGTDTWYQAPVEIQPVPGYENRDYFTIQYVNQENGDTKGYRGTQRLCNPVDYKDRHWQIKPHPNNANAFYLWENENLNDEFYTSSYWDGNVMYLEHSDLSNTWTLHGKYYYLGFDENDRVSKAIGNKYYMAQLNLRIYRYVGGTLDIEDDFEDTPAANTSGQIQPWQNYEYPDYLPVSDSKEGTEVNSVIETAKTYYASDTATSNIESVFGSKTKVETGKELYNIQRQNDGRVLTDKSVIYRADDYGATGVNKFGSYEPGDFSVTLSTLGQEWMYTESIDTTAPLDVVYLFDISGSMDIKYQEAMRWEAAMKAINTSMKNILDRNPENRVGLVAFSGTSKQILPLDRYVPNSNGEFLTKSTQRRTYNKNYYPLTTGAGQQYHTVDARIQTAAELSYEGTSAGSIRPAGQVPVTDFAFSWAWDKTYTQRAIQDAYDTFFEMSKLNSNYLTYEVAGTRCPRQPVVVLVTDGDPTLCSDNFMDPKRDVPYGQGEVHAIEGYYTVLTANYFKSLTSALYQKRSNFFTIGVGCSTEYVTAVLEPSANRMEVCRSQPEGSNAKKFYDLLENIPGKSGGNITQVVKDQLKADYNTELLGVGYSTALLRGKYNLYNGRYNYCDKAWFGDMTEENLNTIFTDILERTQLINDYHFLLKDGTELSISDPIGDNMEIKGAPVLRFYGQNYAADDQVKTGVDKDGNSYVIYRWSYIANRRPSDSKANSGTKVPLNGISAKITTTPSGKQQIDFNVPSEVVPTYYPDLFKQFYYEELPVRLIYRVGLSEAEKTRLESIAGEIHDRTYFTNAFDKDTKEALTTVTFVPDDTNPYYNAILSKETPKDKNVTETSAYSWKEYMVGEKVVHKLGNNGKLLISRPNTLNLVVEKEWENVQNVPSSIKINLIGKLTIKTVGKEEEPGEDIGYSVKETVELSAANGWRYEWKNVKTEEIVGDTIRIFSDFHIEEASTSYHVTYKDKDGNILIPDKIFVSNENNELIEKNTVPANSGKITVINSPEYSLPNSGGNGIQMYIRSGLTLCCVASVIYIFKRWTLLNRDKGVKNSAL